VLTRQQHDEQQQWLEAELAMPRTPAFLAVAAHHPLYSNGQHRDNPKLISQWDSLLRRHNVDLYLSGHDHDLQHLEFKGHPTSFVISGGGGAELVGWTTPPQRRGPWGLRALGFTDLQISKEEVVITYQQGCNCPLRVQKAGRHHRTLVIAQLNRLLLFSDQNAYTRPTIMP
jgi:tartrate-resistant acid phosphatase type 5